MDKIHLNIVDESGFVIGMDTRKNIHAKGLLHQEIHVWFFTPEGGIIFQHRSPDKETWPDLLDATIGGHVEIGDDFDSTVLKEMKEECGVEVPESDLYFLGKTRRRDIDSITGADNNVIRALYAVRYQGRLQDLRIEIGKSVGFEIWPIEKLLNLNQGDAKKFVPALIDESGIEVFRHIRQLL